MKTVTQILLIGVISCLLLHCQPNQSGHLTNKTNTVNSLIDSLQLKYPQINKERATKSLQQLLTSWTSADGSEKEMVDFCLKNYVASDADRLILLNKLGNALESLYGSFNKISVDLKIPLHLQGEQLTAIDHLLGGYDVAAHFSDDMYANKLAFVTILNFPAYTTNEKEQLGKTWSRDEWAAARLGDCFTSRIPAEIKQEASRVSTDADSYISEYNIMMGTLLNKDGQTLFPADMKLISHWNLRDELKSNYANTSTGLEKQEMIYQVMLDIIHQSIPQEVINNGAVQWDPYTNKVWKDKKEIQATPEANVRYQHLLNNFKVLAKSDPYNNTYPTYIERAFDQNMEMNKAYVQQLFTDFVSSSQTKDVASLIEKRLGRSLRPFDIWYDGFKPRSGVDEEELNSLTRKLYPNAAAYEKALPQFLLKLGFSNEQADYLCSKIQVDASRGAGHAWGAAMRGEKARLRSRIGAEGMDYKAYNIGMHEFGHNVEQTLSLYNVEQYTLNGVPNTAFTEALAFIFQKRDLALLGMKASNPQMQSLQTLDNFWSCYEIMGVSLVDMEVWEWLYKHPDATAAQLKDEVIAIAQRIWNSYYAPILGASDSPILAIYSHMIDNPLYLSNYPMGHLIEFQLEEHIRDKNFAEEVMRIFALGRLTPNVWMQQAVGCDVTAQPLLEATKRAILDIN